MAIQFRHQTLRPPGKNLTALDTFLDDHRMGLALVSTSGLILLANDLFLSRSDLPHAMIGSLPVSHLAHNWSSHLSARDAHVLTEWLLPHLPSNEMWNGIVQEHREEGNRTVTLFRGTLSLSGKEHLFLFQGGPTRKLQSGRLAMHFPFLKNHLLPILLDLRDYDTLLPFFFETDSPPRQTTVLLSEESRWLPETSFFRITSRQKNPLDAPQWASLLSERVELPFYAPARRALFSREPSLPEQISLNLPLFWETSFYGWIIWPFPGTGSHRGTAYRKKFLAACDLSEQLHRIRTDLLLAPVLEREKMTGLYTQRGVLKSLQDLMSKQKSQRDFGLIGITLADPAGIGPLLTHLQTFLRGSDLLGHTSPMEFLLIITDSDRERTQKTFRRLLSVFTPIILSDFRLNARIGRCHYPEDGSTPIRLLRKAFLNDAVHVGHAYQEALFTTSEHSSNRQKNR
ncbi:MAG: GGDEF domain-containing protein [Leptospirales bacterium]